MWVLFCCAFFTCASRRCLSSGLFRLHRQPPYMHFHTIPHFRRYESPRRTCISTPSPTSAGTNPLAVHAFPHHPPFPQVRIPSPYMHFHTIPHFRRYESPRRTCISTPSPISAGTNPLAIPAFFRHPAFPQVQNTRPLNSGRVLYPSISVLIFSDSIRSPQTYRQTAFFGISVCVRRRHGSHRCG